MEVVEETLEESVDEEEGGCLSGMGIAKEERGGGAEGAEEGFAAEGREKASTAEGREEDSAAEGREGHSTVSSSSSSSSTSISISFITMIDLDFFRVSAGVAFDNTSLSKYEVVGVAPRENGEGAGKPGDGTACSFRADKRKGKTSFRGSTSFFGSGGGEGVSNNGKNANLDFILTGDGAGLSAEQGGGLNAGVGLGLSDGGGLLDSSFKRGNNPTGTADK